MGTDAFQEAPVFNIMSACCKHVFLVTDETKIEETVRTAFELRTGSPWGAQRACVLLSTVTASRGGRLCSRTRSPSGCTKHSQKATKRRRPLQCAAAATFSAQPSHAAIRTDAAAKQSGTGRDSRGKCEGPRILRTVQLWASEGNDPKTAGYASPRFRATPDGQSARAHVDCDAPRHHCGPTPPNRQFRP